MKAFRQISQRTNGFARSRRCMQTSAVRRAITTLEMPAMSPTMTEGGIAHWKKKEGEAFSAGDVLLEIETDKATIDVEAQDDGIVGKILAPDGTKNVKVGKPIALLAEEGDDISNLELPKESEAPPIQPAPEASTSAPQAQPQQPPSPAQAERQPTPSAPPTRPHAVPSHPRPLFPSVQRLLAEHNIQSPEKIKGTGVRGMLTKGDVLAYLGKASDPLGTYKAALEKEKEAAKSEKAPKKKEEPVVLDGAAIRRLIVTNMLERSVKARAPPATPRPDFDSIIADYLPPSKQPSAPSPPPPSEPKSRRASDYLDGLL